MEMVEGGLQGGWGLGWITLLPPSRRREQGGPPQTMVRKSATRFHAHAIPKHLGSPPAPGEPASFPQPLPLFGAQELGSCTVSKKLPW